ncbi:solute carrier family 26 member 6-like isoform X2 [Mastacembelus armatus]|uniref:solute carrier family 26 member 6-like isoform X2 n=1 Tax=Mastacembelus armatus TaxID=205130 RepID=UPI000E461DD9|nr:solute carrier family 26 member 6-like isoform X2 [Mastacembelus armatus]
MNNNCQGPQAERRSSYRKPASSSAAEAAQTVMDMEEREYFVHREVLDELRLDAVAQKRMRPFKSTLGERMKESLRCSVPRLKQTVMSWVPVLDWLPHYSFRENFMGDLISGCSVSVMHLPQGMAYAPLAALRPVYGLYTSFYPVLVYFIFGTSRHISIGTFAVISMMVGSVTQRLAPEQNFIVNGTNGSKVDTEARDAARVQIACALALLTGIFQILLGLVRFGFMVTYLSQPLIRAYTTASAWQVATSQLKYLFGVSTGQYSGPLSAIYTIVDICHLLPNTKFPELTIGLISLAVLIVIKEINSCYRQKLLVPIPIEIILIIIVTLIVHYCGLTSKYDLDVVGEIPNGLMVPHVPDTTLFSMMIGDAFAVAIVSYTINISLARTFALKHAYKVDNNQELIALGLSNTVGGFFQCYSVTSSMSRSLVQESTGGKTQVAGIISSIVVLITILRIGSLFEDLPKVVLSAVVFVNLKGMFMQMKDVYTLWKTSKTDLLVWLVTFTCTILLNLDIGLAASVGFSLLMIIFRLQLPHYSILGLIPATDLYLDIETYKEAKEIPGIKIFRSSATICHTNAEMYLDALQKKIGFDIGNLLMAKKKQAAELKHKRQKEKKEAKKKNKPGRHLFKGTFSLKKPEIREAGFPAGQTHMNSADFRLRETSTEGPDMGQVNWAYQHDTSTLNLDSSHGDDVHHDGEENRRACGSHTHSIILDISTTNFMDIVTVNTLKNIFRDFEELHLDVYLAGCQACVVKQLETAGFFLETISKSRLFVTVHDAVLFILMKHKQTDFILS